MINHSWNWKIVINKIDTSHGLAQIVYLCGQNHLPIIWTKTGTCSWFRLSQYRNCSCRPFPGLDMIKVFTTNLGKLQIKNMRTIPIKTPDDDRWILRKWLLVALFSPSFLDAKVFFRSLFRSDKISSSLYKKDFLLFLVLEADFETNSMDVFPIPLDSTLDPETWLTRLVSGILRLCCSSFEERSGWLLPDL